MQNNKIQMAWLKGWLVNWQHLNQVHRVARQAHLNQAHRVARQAHLNQAHR